MNRTFRLLVLALCGFVTSFGAHIVATNLPGYAALVGAGALMIGVLIAVYDFAELFAKPAAGLLADRRGMKLTLIGGLLTFIAGSLLFLVIPSRLLVVVRFVQGLGAAALSTVSISLVARYFDDRRGSAFGVYNAIKGAGYIVAPAAGGFITHAFGFSAIFVVSAGIALVATLLCVFLPGDDRGVLDDDDEPSFRETLRIFMDPRLTPIYGIIVINMFLVGVLFGFLPVYLRGLDYSTRDAGVVLSVATAAYLLVQPAAGFLADRYDIRATVIAGLLLAATAIGAATFVSGVPLVLVVIAAGAGVGIVWTNSDAMVGATVSPKQLGVGIGAAQSFKELGDMAGPLAVGALTQFFGIRVAFVACAVVGIGCLVLLLRSPGLRRA
jgi:MFS family permease